MELVGCLLGDGAFTLTHWHSQRDAWNGLNENGTAEHKAAHEKRLG